MTQAGDQPGKTSPAGLLAAAIATAALTVHAPALAAGGDSALQRNHGMLMLDYQVVDVQGDQPLDLFGFRVNNRVAEGLYLGAGMSAPLFKGAYGGFATFDIGAHVQRRLVGPLFATAGIALGGGAGGRNVENAKSLAGTGGFVKSYLGLGYDFGPVSLGAQITRMRFNRAAVGGTQANLFLQIPYSYFTGPFSRHGEPVAADDWRQASASERMLTAVLDNYWQRDAVGTNKEPFNILDLQYSHFLSTDTYWFVNLGVGYRGLPLSNQLLGGLGQRWPLSPRLALYGQLGIGSGIYAPEVIDTGPGLLVYPKVALEFALARDLGLAISTGYLLAPKGSSRNAALGIALTRHLRAGGDGRGAAPGAQPTWRAFRVSLIQKTDFDIRYRDVDRGQVRMIGLQADVILDANWYIAMQGAAAYSTYLGYPGYGEVLGGFGWQTTAGRSDRWQGFGQLLAGTNVHGVALQGSAGLRWTLGEGSSLSLQAGRIVARNRTGQRFVAGNVVFGFDYRFSTAGW